MGRNKKKSMIIWTLIIAIVIAPIIYVQCNKVIYKERVVDYLIEEKGYKKTEIKSIKGIWGVKLPPFYSVVIFENEPYVEYIYFAHDDVIQFEYRLTEEGVRKGIVKEDLKNYDSNF